MNNSYDHQLDDQLTVNRTLMYTIDTDISRSTLITTAPAVVVMECIREYSNSGDDYEKYCDYVMTAVVNLLHTKGYAARQIGLEDHINADIIFMGGDM